MRDTDFQAFGPGWETDNGEPPRRQRQRLRRGRFGVAAVAFFGLALAYLGTGWLH